MPAFTIISISDGLYGCVALQVVPWVDLDDGDNPDKRGSRPGIPEKRYRLAVGSGVCLQAVVNGVIAPLDSALSASPPVGGMFSASLAEGAVAPTWYPSVANQSSIVRARFAWTGHYAIAVRMLGGGCEIIPFDVENS